MAAVVHFLCLHDHIAVPAWTQGHRADPEVMLFDIPLDSRYGQRMQQTAPAVCAAYGVYFTWNLLDLWRGPWTLAAEPDEASNPRQQFSGMTEWVAPTLDDARATGRALTDAGAREVLAYGSVVVGGADPVSDIDLVAIFDDVDYNQRWRLRLHLLNIAHDACGYNVGILVTDVPEWAAQNKMASSFAAAIRDDLVVVAAGPADDSAVRWDKPQALPDTDIEASYHHLNEAVLRLDRMSSHIRSESPRRNVFVSWAAADVIKEALRALGAAALIDARALHS